MTDLPLLKYACDIEPGEESVGLTYRGRSYHLPLEGFRPELLRLFDGRRTITQIARSSGASHAIVESVVDRLSKIPLVVDGRDVLRDDGCLSGSELFWRLERLLYRWRYDGPRAVACDDLEREIATGSAPESVVRGYCIEIAHQLRNTPTEIAVAIASSPTVAVRRLFIRFWDEEYDHGDKLMDVLAGWMPRDEIEGAAPLPTTLGLLNAYNWWASQDVLLYATALMRDEQSVLDAEVPPDRDIALGMERCYDVPESVVKFFRWHAEFDRDEGHGFFPEEVFREFPVIDRARARRIVGALRLIIDLYDSFYDGILRYYGAHGVKTRWGLERELTA